MNKLFKKMKTLYVQSTWVKVVLISAGLAIGYGSHIYTKKNDGVIEQAAEAILRTQGIDVDLSPDD